MKPAAWQFRLLTGYTAVGGNEDARDGVSDEPVMNPVPGETQHKSEVFAHRPQLVWLVDPRGYL